LYAQQQNEIDDGKAERKVVRILEEESTKDKETTADKEGTASTKTAVNTEEKGNASTKFSQCQYKLGEELVTGAWINR
jgi:hypothetical protein